MKAFEVRNASIQPQYDSVMEEIKIAMKRGWKSTPVGRGSLYREVVRMLSSDGFDVKIIQRSDDSKSYNEVSWANATEEDRVGTIDYTIDYAIDYTIAENQEANDEGNEINSVATQC